MASILNKISISDNALIWERLKAKLATMGLKPESNPALSLELIRDIRQELREAA
jgi:hypothetical protein